MRKIITAILGAALAACAFSVWAGTLDDVKAKGILTCGTNPATAGFSIPDNDGKWTGFVVDYCRAVAAGVLGDATKVKFIPLNAKDGIVNLTEERPAKDAIRRYLSCSGNFRPHAHRRCAQVAMVAGRDVVARDLK